MSSHRTAQLACLGAILALHALVLHLYYVPVVNGSDANGYHVAARMIEKHGRLCQLPTDDLAFLGRQWVFNDRGEAYSKYPPLYPALNGLLMKGFGEAVGLLLNPLAAWLVVLGTYFLCRCWLSGWWAVAAALVLATNPVLNAFTFDQGSHVVGTAAATFGYALLFAALRRAGRRRRALLLGSGLLVGFAAGVRYSEALLAIPPVVCILGRAAKGRVADLATWLSAWAIPCAGVAAYHWSAFGHPLTTGYSLTGEQDAFGLGYFLAHLRVYVPGMVTDGIGPFFLLSCCWLFIVWRRDRRDGLFHAAWILPITVLYLGYYYSLARPTAFFMRFWLALFPALVVQALLFAREVLATPTLLRDRSALIAAALLCQCGWGAFASLQTMEHRYCGMKARHEAVQAVQRHVPPGSVVFSDATVADAIDYHQKYRLYPAAMLDRDELLVSLAGDLMPGPDSLQQRRAQALKRALLDVDQHAFRRRINQIIDLPRQGGVGAYLVVRRDACDQLRATYHECYDLVDVASIPGGGRHRLRKPIAVRGAPDLRVLRIVPR